jgi:hypothetical protein
VSKLDQDSSVWKKWEGPRNTVLSSAIECWIPKEDLLAFLNSLPGPALTMTDLEQRMKHMIGEEYIGAPEPKLEAECLAIYKAETEAGTELPAIIGRLSDYIGEQWLRLRDEKRAEDAQRSEESRLERERRLRTRVRYRSEKWTVLCGCCALASANCGLVENELINSRKWPTTSIMIPTQLHSIVWGKRAASRTSSRPTAVESALYGLTAAVCACRGSCCRAGRKGRGCWRGFPCGACASVPDAQPTGLRP